MGLFGKLTIWFLATITILVVLIIAITVTYVDRQGTSPYSLMLATLLPDVRAAYEQGGPAALERKLAELRQRARLEFYLVDANGRDVLTGADRSAWTRDPVFRMRRTGVRSETDGQYYLVTTGSPQRLFWWFLSPLHAALVAIIALLCYAFAFYVTSPVRDLTRTVERVGRGDFAARASSQRQDELGQLARSFNAMAERLGTLVEAERRLLLDISHELRSPLARLNVALELARENRAEHAWERIQKEADRLNALVGELLQVTRAEGDPQGKRKDAVDWSALVREIVAGNVIEAEATAKTLSLSAQPGLMLQGDPELLRRAAENVIRNAIRHTPAGARVECRLERQANEAVLTVRDYGPGVPDDDVPRIFEPFYRVGWDRSRDSGGTGLGLSIAQRSVVLHGGSIRARNVAPGLEVEIRVPLQAAEVSAQARQ
jgi:two-component system sensor histidine kinase CpxA